MGTRSVDAIAKENRPPAVARALAYIQNPAGDRFEDVALDVFTHQVRHNEPYRHYCHGRGIASEGVTSWQEIPPLPVAAWKSARLTTARTRRVFVTSGTTQGANRRGRHYFPDLALYDAAWQGPFRRHVLPDRASMQILSLIPGEETAPESSLSYMVTRALARFGAPGSGTYLGPTGLDYSGITAALHAAQERDDPVLLLGTFLGLATLLDLLREDHRCFALPAGSRLLDTGGWKGRRREVSREELLAL